MNRESFNPGGFWAHTLYHLRSQIGRSWWHHCPVIFRMNWNMCKLFSHSKVSLFPFIAVFGRTEYKHCLPAKVNQVESWELQLSLGEKNPKRQQQTLPYLACKDSDINLTVCGYRTVSFLFGEGETETYTYCKFLTNCHISLQVKPSCSILPLVPMLKWSRSFVNFKEACSGGVFGRLYFWHTVHYHQPHQALGFQVAEDQKLGASVRNWNKDSCLDFAHMFYHFKKEQGIP